MVRRLQTLLTTQLAEDSDGMQDFADILPRDVFEPGSPVGGVTPCIQQQWGIPASCVVCAGTTGDAQTQNVETVLHAI